MLALRVESGNKLRVGHGDTHHAAMAAWAEPQSDPHADDPNGAVGRPRIDRSIVFQGADDPGSIIRSRSATTNGTPPGMAGRAT